MFLMKLRLNIFDEDRAYRFGVSQSTVSRNFHRVLDVMFVKTQSLIHWPSRDALRLSVPSSFRKFFRKYAVIIDCTEVFMEQPSNLLSRAQVWSNYKHHSTVKFLIGRAPQGSICFLSKCWGGRATDTEITENSDLMNKLMPGDLVLADRGFFVDEYCGMAMAEVKKLLGYSVNISERLVNVIPFQKYALNTWDEQFKCDQQTIRAGVKVCAVCDVLFSEPTEQSSHFNFQSKLSLDWLFEEDMFEEDMFEEDMFEDHSPKGWRCSTSDSTPLHLNVGGRHFHLSRQLAARFPQTRLGRIATCGDPSGCLELCDDYSVDRRELFFDRDPEVFAYVFGFYHTGLLWLRDALCPRQLTDEIEYWGVRLCSTRHCCRILFEERRDELNDHLKVQQELEAELEDGEEEEEGAFGAMRYRSTRLKLWSLLEKPLSSFTAKLMSVVSTVFVLVSLVAMTLSTTQEFGTSPTSSTTGHRIVESLESVCVAFFTAEYLGRIVSTPNPRRFLRGALNAVDLLAILPFYIQVLFEWLAEDADVQEFDDEVRTVGRVGKLGQVLKIIRLMRILRILKLARHSTGIRAFAFTLRQCSEQVGCLFLFIAMGIFIFSALVYAAEHERPATKFSSIPACWWWATVSISQVGYGDMCPDSVLGQLVCVACVSLGIILNSLPISILYNKFSDYYSKLKEHALTARLRQRQGGIKFGIQAQRRFSNCLCAQLSVIRGTPSPGRQSPAND
uniref:potassium voltage-gated channel subfamily V member 2 n=1 Tax=Myxine glutinosa TaxID=7769 RepID=UPI00358FD37A